MTDFTTDSYVQLLKSIWDKILKVVIAVASAILGALGANAMNVSI